MMSDMNMFGFIRLNGGASFAAGNLYFSTVASVLIHDIMFIFSDFKLRVNYTIIY